MLSKEEIRRGVRSIRDSVAPPTPTAVAEIQSHVLNLPALRDAKTWFMYVSFGSEVSTHELIRTLLVRGDTVTVPRIVSAGEMVPQQIRAFDELRLGEFGILSPLPGETFTGAIDVCVCPGVAFTERGERLGAGGGYYDRYLAAHRPRTTIGLAFDFQVKPVLPIEEHDGHMDYIVTEKRIIHPGAPS